MGNFSLDRKDSDSVPPLIAPIEQQLEAKKAAKFWKDTGMKQLEQKQFDIACYSFSQSLHISYDLECHWKRGLIYRLQGNYYHSSRYPSLQQKAVTLHNKAGQDFSEVIKMTTSQYDRAFAYVCRADGFAKRGLWELAMADVNEHLRQMKNEKN